MQFSTLKRFRFAAAMLVLFVPWTSQAAPSDPLSATELAALPDFCQAKQAAMRGDRAAATMWEQQFGHNNFLVINHYCIGLVMLNRGRLAFGKEKGNRGQYLQRAINDFSYVINAWPKDFYLQADAHLGAGQAMQLSGQDMKAMGFFIKAIGLRPDFPQAYVTLADVWVGRGDKAKAREVLEQGLRNTGNDELLVRRLARLEASPSSPPPPRAGAPLPGRTTNAQGSARKP